jgi:hypothetical protein
MAGMKGKGSRHEKKEKEEYAEEGDMKTEVEGVIDAVLKENSEWRKGWGKDYRKGK